MAGDLLDGHELRELEHIARQSFGRPPLGGEEFELFDGSLMALGTDDFPVKAVDPDSDWPEIQVAYLASLLTVNSICSLSADITKGDDTAYSAPPPGKLSRHRRKPSGGEYGLAGRGNNVLYSVRTSSAFFG